MPRLAPRAELERVPGEAEAGDVGDRVHAGHVGQRDAGRVEPRRRLDEALVAGGVQGILLQRRRHHADADRLAEDEHVAGLGVGIAPDLARVDQAHDDEAVDRLDRIDRVAAGDRDARLATDRLAAADDLADLLGRQLVDRHRDQGQGHDRPAAHRIHVADRVGRGDAAEVERVVDDRHEEVGRRDQRLLVVELVDGGVVGGLDADHQLRRHQAAGARAKDFGKDTGRDLAAAAAAVREAGEAQARRVERGRAGGRCVHGCPIGTGREPGGFCQRPGERVGHRPATRPRTARRSAAGRKSGSRAAHWERRRRAKASSAQKRRASTASAPGSPTGK